MAPSLPDSIHLLASRFEDLVCDICGSPATCISRDLILAGDIDGIRNYEPGEIKIRCDDHKVDPVIVNKSVMNYNSHNWRWFMTPSTPDNPGERVCVCETCGIENLGDPNEFDIDYPPCESL